MKTDPKTTLNAAQAAREMCNDREAAACYGALLLRDPENWEALFFTAYYAAKKERFTDTGFTNNALANAFDKALRLMCDALKDDPAAARADFRLLMRYFHTYVDSYSAVCLSVHSGSNGTKRGKGNCPGRTEDMLPLLAHAERVLEQLDEKTLTLLDKEEILTSYLPSLYKKTVEIGTICSNSATKSISFFRIRKNGSGSLRIVEEHVALIRRTEPGYDPPYCKAREAFTPEAKRRAVLMLIIIGAAVLNIALALFFSLR